MYSIVGITDERSECERCGKTGLKRTVVLDDGSSYMFVGVCCAERLTGLPGDVVRRNAVAAQETSDKEASDLEWGAILGARHYSQLKLYAHSGVVADLRRARRAMARVVDQSSLSREVVLSHLARRWGEDIVGVLREKL